MNEIASPGGFRNLLKRTVTGLALVSVALGALYAGALAFWLLVSLLAVAMMAEWGGLMQVGVPKTAIAIAAMAVFLVVLQWLAPPDSRNSLIALAVGTSAVAIATVSLRLGAGFLYIGLAILAILFVREGSGIVLTLWTLAIVWGTDVGAYFSGKAIGGPKLAPGLSPNKTWAGLLGGIAAALLVSSLVVLNTDLPRWLIPVAAALAVVAQSGDLYESWLKRRAGVKDASNLFPGHGGALDRLDGLLPVAIVVAGMAASGRI